MTKPAIAVGALLMACVAATFAEEWQVPAGVIQQRKDGVVPGRVHTFLNSDVVEMEFRVRDLSSQETSISSKELVLPASNQSVGTRARGKWGEYFTLENGVDLAIHRGSRWDAAAGETVSESIKPQYYSRLALQPWEKSEFSLGQVVSVEQQGAETRANELWRTNLAYKQQLGRMTDFHLEVSHEEQSPDSLQLPIRTEVVGGAFSQQLGRPELKLLVGVKNSTQTREGTAMDNLESFRREAGLDWKASKQVEFYGGGVLADEARPQTLSEESLILYEFRSRWVPVPIFQLSGGLSLDGRQQSEAAAAGQTKWLLRGDLQPTPELSLFTQLQWDQWNRDEATGTDPVREEKFLLGAGPKIRLGETTRFSAEYGLARSAAGDSGQESAVEHMLSFVLSRDF